MLFGITNFFHDDSMSGFRFSLLKAVSQICDPPYIDEIVEYLGRGNITDSSIVKLLMGVSIMSANDREFK